jgi:hypothetical protein
MSFIIRGAQGLSFALPIDYAVERFPALARHASAASGATSSSRSAPNP